MNTLFDLPTPNPKHPAKYTDALLSAFVKMTYGKNKILDPFGGTGKVFLLNRWYPNAEIQAVEIEPEWAKINPRTTLGNALHLPWQNDYFDCICTSPTYGNSMAIEGNKENWRNPEWKLFTYSSLLGRSLSSDNSGKLRGEKYIEFHKKAWIESTRVLCEGGYFILNIKDHIKRGSVIPVTNWHIEILENLGYEILERIDIECPGYGYRNKKAMETYIKHESVIKFVLKSKTPANKAWSGLVESGGELPAEKSYSKGSAPA